MNLIIKLLKLRITKVFLFFLFIAFIASIYFYKHWYYVQYNKCIGFYYVHKGDKAYRDKNYQRAIDYYKFALKKYPGHSRASCNLGNIYVSFENYYEAVNSYEHALKYNPNFMVCRMDLGIILSERMADYDKAIQEYGRIVNAKPFTINIPFVYNNAGPTKKNKGLAYYNMGLAYRGKAVYVDSKTQAAAKYLKKAQDSYKKAAQYLDKDYDNTFNLALTSHLLGDYNTARNEYCKAINIRPNSFEAHYNYALLLRSMNHNIEALEELERTTMLLDYFGDDKKNKYVFGIINEIKRRILSEGGYQYLKDRQELTAVSDSDIKYYNGKVVAEKQKEYDMTQLLKCDYKKLEEK